jgi:hypothetical protein
MLPARPLGSTFEAGGARRAAGGGRRIQLPAGATPGSIVIGWAMIHSESTV